jgi:hypothetical protein
MLVAPAANWREAAEKARYIIRLYASTLAMVTRNAAR